MGTKTKRSRTPKGRIVKRFLIIIILIFSFAACGHDERAKIIDVYDQERWGNVNGNTIVEYKDGKREILSGKLGKAGEIIVVFRKDGRIRDSKETTIKTR